ncbi:TerB family tellurite resistance protein [Maribacter sp. PR1]|uniref:TerB family tellurite resistance protein n=1 Tax=Maribacter cobaltidurans TaxID=1178778 RepID=A0ABU7IQ30_9FLAO|nr:MULTISPECIES: TerB family tellurite resistance protein [Maribacter]MDC6387596.1 TerB family tellurite resistance protein [Maribacter sp. PR1]MEE1974984.1 TerB family tellurite resistance protein [Maribacter cobaltidurans]
MSIADLYTSGEHRRNLAHFAALATLASVDGEVSTEEKKLLDRFATKLDITQAEYDEVLKKENVYPIQATNSSEQRLERLYDLFRIVYSDHKMDHEEKLLVKKYAIGLGFSGDKADAVIERSVEIFGGKLDFEDYLYLVKK